MDTIRQRERRKGKGSLKENAGFGFLGKKLYQVIDGYMLPASDACGVTGNPAN